LMVDKEGSGVAMPNNRKIWIFSVDYENWNIVLDRKIWAVKRERDKRNIAKGDVLIFFVKGSRPPCFMGAYEVVSDWRQATEIIWREERKSNRIIYTWQISIEPIQLGTANVKDLVPQLDFIRHKDYWPLYLMGTPANYGQPIREEDFRLILSELAKPQIQVSFRPSRIPPTIREGITITLPSAAVPVAPPTPTPSHSELIEMLQQIGEAFGFIVKIGEPTPGKVYYLDLTWRDYEDHAPMKVFEVEFSKDIDSALSRLTDAYDMWRAEQLYLIVADERDLERARKLVEPHLRGAFSRIGKRLKVLAWSQVRELYEGLKAHIDLVKDFAKR
ncbi:MAG: EVE domain-containing protein, partial [Candidatus Bathyarchaeia archaeon]